MYRIYHEYSGKKLRIDVHPLSESNTYEDAKEIAKDRVKTYGGIAWIIDMYGETKYFVSMEMKESEYS